MSGGFWGRLGLFWRWFRGLGGRKVMPEQEPQSCQAEQQDDQQEQEDDPGASFGCRHAGNMAECGDYINSGKSFLSS